MNISIEFLQNILDLRHKEIPKTVMDRARKSFIDYLAVTCAGAEFQKEKLGNYYVFSEPENGSFKAIGTRRNFTMKETVFLNGLNAHALDFDDGTNSGIIHLGSPVFSLLLPLAQKYDIFIEELLRAAIIGYEASYTMAVSIQPSHKQMGYHATGTCGVIGSAIAASCMLGFNDEEIFQAFSTACVSATGMLKVLDDGSELKPYNVAKTALSSLISVQLAKSGFKGSSNPLGGNRGFFKMMTGKEEVELKPVLLGGTYAIMKSYTKPYASCRYTHPAVEATVIIRNKYGLKAKEVLSMDVATYSLAVSGHDHTEILGPQSAKMSIPYATAVALISGKAGLNEFTDQSVKVKEVLDLTKKVHVVPDKALSAVFPEVQAAIVNIQTHRGIFTERVDFPKGEPENPLSEEEFRERYDDLMEYAGFDETVGREVFELLSQEGTSINDVLEKL